MRLSVYFSWMCLEGGHLQRFMLKAFRSVLLWLYLGLCVVLAWCKVLQKSVSFQTTTKTLSCFSSCYSGFVALTVIRQTRFWAMLHEIKSLVQDLEEDEAAEKVWVARTRRIIVVFSCQTVTLSIFTAASVVLHFTISGDDTMVYLWPFVPYAGSWGVYVARLVTGVGVSLIVLTISFVVITLGCTTSAATGMHHALAQGLLLEAATPEVVGNAVALHQRLRRVTLDMTDFFAANLAHVMASSFFHSSAALIQVLASGVMTSTTVFLLLRVVVVFLQLSYLSQELSDSSLLLQGSAYRAATSRGTGPAEARALVLVMLAASRTPALSCKGLGRLSLASAGRAFRQLYSVVNVLKSRY
ncbi:Odorant receptor 9 [Frankliniella occidentalis]|nr:Odorant receptor 9 [Frankliniella occidentalis]